MTLPARLATACPGWSAQATPDGWLLTLPSGDTAEIATDAAFAAWLAHRERERTREEATDDRD